MNALLQQLGSALSGLTWSAWHFLSFPFNRRSRWRSLRVLAVCRDPFVLERIRLSELIPDPFEVTLGPLKAGAHNVSEYELLCLASLVKAANASKVFEIGTFDGRSSRAMALNLVPDGCLVTLNLPPGEGVNSAGVCNVDTGLNTKVISGNRFLGTLEAACIRQVYGDSATFDFGPYEGCMDLVFIDGSHVFDYVKNDTEAAIRMIKPAGGWILWHDATLYGVAPYLKKQIREFGWPVRLIDGTTLMVGYCREGEMTCVPLKDG